jgi:predicted DNA-binding transcriptional regulator AlpA
MNKQSIFCERAKKMQDAQIDRTGTPLAVSAKDLAKMLAVSIRQVWRLNSAGKLPRPVRLGGSVRWRRDEIVAFVAAGCPDRKVWEAVNSRGGAA